MTEAFQALRTWRDAEAEKARAGGAEMFLGKPDAWYASPHFFCTSGHVSARVLKNEEEGDLCMACLKPVLLGPPMSEADYAPIAATFHDRACGEVETPPQGEFDSMPDSR